MQPTRPLWRTCQLNFLLDPGGKSWAEMGDASVGTKRPRNLIDGKFQGKQPGKSTGSAKPQSNRGIHKSSAENWEYCAKYGLDLYTKYA